MGYRSAVAGNRPEEVVTAPMLLQEWHSVAFLHWRCDPDVLARVLPSGLTADVLDGSAWIGLTPFVVRRQRPPALPAVPKLSDFPETNLRTYVTAPDGTDGLWFLSLDVASLATVLAARAAVGAPYHWAGMQVHHRGEAGTVEYVGARHPTRHAAYRVRVRPRGGSADGMSPLMDALVGRWRAYTTHLGRLLVVPVEHEPWPVQEAELSACEESLAAAAGLPQLGTPELVHYAECVHARLGPPRLVGSQAPR